MLRLLQTAFSGVLVSKFSRGGMPPDPPRRLAPSALGMKSLYRNCMTNASKLASPLLTLKKCCLICIHQNHLSVINLSHTHLCYRAHSSVIYFSPVSYTRPIVINYDNRQKVHILKYYTNTTVVQDVTNQTVTSLAGEASYNIKISLK